MNTKETFLDIQEDSDFSLHNIPFGVFHLKSENKLKARCATRIGNLIIDLSKLFILGLLVIPSVDSNIFSLNSLNSFIETGEDVWKSTRDQLQNLFSIESRLQRLDYMNNFVFKEADCIMCLPLEIGDFTDFYSGKQHAINVGSIFRGANNALPKNWSWMPTGYHARASSIMVSPSNFSRPSGQVRVKSDQKPVLIKSQKVDFELELGAVIGKSNQLGQPIKIDDAHKYVFGYVLLNDVSLRDIQAWEYVPLGPFTGKNAISVISPWVVTAQALIPFRESLQVQDPDPLEYLKSSNLFVYNISLIVSIKSSQMKNFQIISETNSTNLYWNTEQQITHHTISGCNLRVGDLLGSGTISGKTRNQFGSFLELTWNGKNSLILKETQETRLFWEDGDQIIFQGKGSKEGINVGFGVCRVTLV